jgi:hypothetical protein
LCKQKKPTSISQRSNIDISRNEFNNNIIMQMILDAYKQAQQVLVI